MIGFGGRRLHQGESPNEVRILPDGGAGDREVLHRTQRMDAPVCVSGNLPVADRSCSMRVLVISSPRDVLLDSGFSGMLFDADGAAPTLLFLSTICQAD